MPLKKTAIEWVNTEGSLTNLVYKHFSEIYAVQQRELSAVRAQSWTKWLAGFGGFILAAVGALGIKSVEDLSSESMQLGWSSIRQQLESLGSWSIKSGVGIVLLGGLSIFLPLTGCPDTFFISLQRAPFSAICLSTGAEPKFC